MTTATVNAETSHDPVALLNSLTADELEQRLDQLEAEQKGVKALLRSVRARERARAQLRRERVEFAPPTRR